MAPFSGKTPNYHLKVLLIRTLGKKLSPIYYPLFPPGFGNLRWYYTKKSENFDFAYIYTVDRHTILVSWTGIGINHIPFLYQKRSILWYGSSNTRYSIFIIFANIQFSAENFSKSTNSISVRLSGFVAHMLLQMLSD